MEQHRIQRDLAEHQPPATRESRHTTTRPHLPLLETLNARLPPTLPGWLFPSINNVLGAFGEDWPTLDSPPPTPPPPPSPPLPPMPSRFLNRVRARSSPPTVRLEMIRNPCRFGLIDEEHRGSDIDKRTIELFHELHQMRTLHAEERQTRVSQNKAHLR